MQITTEPRSIQRLLFLEFMGRVSPSYDTSAEDFIFTIFWPRFVMLQRKTTDFRIYYKNAVRVSLSVDKNQ
jgi:hypothetical protein